jgi:mono/diheme cytochrome c family protein
MSPWQALSEFHALALLDLTEAAHVHPAAELHRESTDDPGCDWHFLNGHDSLFNACRLRPGSCRDISARRADISNETWSAAEEIGRLRARRNLPRISLGGTIMKALIANGHRSALAGRVMLARPQWWPALVMAASGCVGLLAVPVGRADPPSEFHQAPLSAASLENPYRAQVSAAQAGGELYAAHCAACHGRSAEGSGNVPALAHTRVQSMPDGEVFWLWGRPVGVTTAPDGALLVTDDGSNSIWRVSYVGDSD